MSDFAGLPVVKPEEVGLASDRIERITRTMERAVEAAEVPGVVTVIARHGKVVHDEAHGYLDMERENELGLDSIFRMYSQTKPITAVAVMQLHEDGAFFLDEPLARYMPEFADRQVIAHAPEEPVRGTPVNLVHTVSAKRELSPSATSSP